MQMTIDICLLTHDILGLYNLASFRQILLVKF